LNTFTIQQQTFAVKQNEFIDAFTVVHQSSYRHIQAVMNDLKFIILDYLAAKKSWILDWRRDFCDWSISCHFIWRVMPSRHLTEYSTLRYIVLLKHTQHWSIDWTRGAAAYLERYVQNSHARVLRNNLFYNQLNVARSCARCYHNSIRS